MKKKFIFILFLFLILLSSCSKDDNEVKYDRPENGFLGINYDGSYSDGTKVYIITLSNDESLKDKNYKISDFKLENLVLVEEIVKAVGIQKLYKKENYQKVLRLTFKDLDFDTDYIIRNKMSKDSRISSVERETEYEIVSSFDDGVYLKNFNTNLNISNMYYINHVGTNKSDSIIVNNLNEFLNVKDNFKYRYMDEEVLEKYDDAYFENNSLMYFEVYSGNNGDQLVLDSIYEMDDKIEINCSYYSTSGADAGVEYYYLLEINGKLMNKKIVYNRHSCGSLWYLF